MGGRTGDRSTQSFWILGIVFVKLFTKVKYDWVSPKFELKVNLKKVAFITAILGNYEKTTKRFVKQDISADFICFCSENLAETNGWEVDPTPYHLTYPSSIDTGKYTNSLRNNQHTFNQAKYYKEQFYRIPRLKDYDVVVWLDGTIEITNSSFASYLYKKLIGEGYLYFTPTHKLERTLHTEARESLFFRYTDKVWNGQRQPRQDVMRQYREYVRNGYVNCPYSEQSQHKEFCGVMMTCVLAWNMRNPMAIDALDEWYLQNLKYTTQDQIGFPYVTQMMKLNGYRAPDSVVVPCDGTSPGDISLCSNMWVKLDHGL